MIGVPENWMIPNDLIFTHPMHRVGLRHFHNFRDQHDSGHQHDHYFVLGDQYHECHVRASDF